MYWFFTAFRSDRECATDSVQISEKMRRRPCQCLDKRSEKKAWAVHGCLNGVLGPGQTEEGETCEEQSQEHAHISVWHQGDCSRGIVKMCKDFIPNFGDKRTGFWPDGSTSSGYYGWLFVFWRLAYNYMWYIVYWSIEATENLGSTWSVLSQ
jgi:hypothetical protein